MGDNPSYVGDEGLESAGYSSKNASQNPPATEDALPTLSSIQSKKDNEREAILPTLSDILGSKERKPQHPNKLQSTDASSAVTVENVSTVTFDEHRANESTGDGDDDADEDGEQNEKLLYSIEENPPWYLALFLGFQHYLTMVGGTVVIPYVLTPAMCVLPHDPVRGAILATILFVSGIVTFLQSTFGSRLPIIQGGSFAFFAPTFAILHTSFAPCDSLNLTALTEEQQQEEWQMRMRAVQGAIMVSSLFQILIGFTGLIGMVVSFITPLAIVPTVTLIGLALFEVAMDKASKHWGISCLTIILMVLFSQYLRGTSLPVPVCSRNGVRFIRVQVFGLFPVLLAILLSWGVCGVLTVSGALSEDSYARTDRATHLIDKSPWVRVPYPGQWGTPTVSAAGAFGMLAGVLASIMESVGDYYACAKLSGAPPPPRHAINRGIGMEGVGCLLAGAWGTGNGTTSYSENIGAIGLTKVGSRRVIQYGALVMVLVGIFAKFCAAIVSIPEPVVGGIFCVMFAMITAVGLSSLQDVDLNSSRNLFVLGFPLFVGLALPKWLENHPGAIHSEAVPELTQIVTVLLKTSMFVGGSLGVFLDNTIPGTARERGLLAWKKHMQGPEGDASEVASKTYDFPFGMSFVRRISFFERVPFCPTFKSWTFKKKT